MRSRAFFSLCLMALVLVSAATGCESIKKSWKWTQSALDPIPSEDLYQENISDDAQRLLALEMAPMDEQIQNLVRMLETQDYYPEEEWFDIVFNRFPWVDGGIVLDRDGTKLIERNKPTLKLYNAQPLLVHGDEWSDRRVRGYLEENDLGPQIYLGNGYMRDGDWKGLTIVHFDPRSLIKYVPDQDGIIVLTPEKVLWPGRYEAEAEKMLQVPWKELLEDDTRGQVEIGSKTFTCLIRYLGGMHLIYAVENPQED